MTFEERIAARLHEALDQLSNAGFININGERDIAASIDGSTEVLVSIEDVARIASTVAATDDSELRICDGHRVHQHENYRRRTQLVQAGNTERSTAPRVVAAGLEAGWSGTHCCVSRP